MNNSSDSNSSFFPMFLASTDLFVCILCIFTNGFIAWITVKTKKIRANRCCIFIALLSVLHIGAKSGSVVPTVIAWTVGTVSQRICPFLHTVGILSGPTALCMILAIAVDRLLSAAFPIWYKHNKSSSYMGIVLFIVFLPAIYDLLAIYIYSLQPENREKMVVCNGFNVVTSASGLFTWLLGIFNSSASVAAYILVAAIFIRQKRQNANSEFLKSTRKIMCSLMVIMLVNTFGWLLGFTFISITHLLIPNISPMGTVITENLEILILDTASSLDALILYFTSSMYRDAYKSCFAFNFNVKNCKNKVIVVAASSNPAIK